MLLSGSRGTGKSSLVKALLNEYEAQGLRLVEVDKHDLISLPDLVEPLESRPERFILFCDDLSFEANEPGYKSLKAILDGSVSAAPDNVLLYATRTAATSCRSTCATTSTPATSGRDPPVRGGRGEDSR